MRYFHKIAMTLILSAAASMAWGQTKVTGTITDENGAPLPGVSVIEAGTANGTSSDPDGKYSITISGDNPALLFSCIGFSYHNEKVSGRTVIDVTMQEDMTVLDDVVVVGYGTQKKINITGSVTSINFEDKMAGRPVLSASASLAGLSAGLNVTQTSGQPGQDNATLRIRGNNSITSSANSPLVLVDGIEWSMDNVNPNDIASISVLKDAASTAIYGTRAANGVILITTKQGEEGKARISYSYSGIIQNAFTNGLEFVSDYPTHMQLINEGAANVGQATIFSESTIRKWEEAKANPDGLNEYGMPNYMAYPNTDWFDEVFGTGYSQEHNLAVSGGGSVLKYYISLGYLDNEGVMNRFNLDSGYRKFSARVNLEANVTKWFKMGAKINVLQQDYGLADIGQGFKYLATSPGIWPGTPNFWGHPASDQELQNANNIFQHMSGQDGHNMAWRGTGSVYAIVSPVKGLSFEATLNYSPRFSEKNTYSIENGKWDYVRNERVTTSTPDNAVNTNTYSRSYTQSAELLARYGKTIRNHSFGVLFGYSAIESMSRGFGASKKGATDWTVTDMGTYSEMYNITSNAKTEWGLRSYFGRINYSFRDRYIFEANLRADGSSKFGSNRRYGIFPSFSAGWIASEESFLRNARTWLSMLKVRLSWGETGNNQGIGNYAWQALYAINNAVIDSQLATGLYISALSNANLQWESTATTDLGIEFGMFNNRFTGEIDLYHKYTSDILYTPAIYLTMGQVSAVPANLGEVRNQGIEITLNWRDRIGKHFDYYVGANFSFNDNMVTKFKGKHQAGWTDNGDGTRTYGNNLNDVSESWGSSPGRLCEGHMLGEHYRYSLYRGSGRGYTGGEVDVTAGPVDGMIRTEADMKWVQAMMDSGYTFNGKKAMSIDQLWYGDLIYADLNGDGNYGDTNDQSFTGWSSTPKYNLGINLGFSVYGFDFNMVWTGAFGFRLNWIASGYNTSTVNNGSGIGTMVAYDHYYYDPENPGDSRTNIDATFPRLTFGVNMDNTFRSDFYEYKGDYLKLKNIQIGYTIPEKITKKFYVQNLRFYASVDNILTITDYPGLDPEIGTSIGYPLMRQVAFGAQITF